MPENTSPYTTNDQMPLIALYYTNGNDDKARLMVAGKYKDLYVIKAKYTSSSLYGGFILFYNHINYQLAHSLVIISPSYLLNDINPRADWQTFEKEILDHLAGGQQDTILGNNLREKLKEFFNVPLCKELTGNLANDNYSAINHIFQKMLQDKMGLQKVEMNVDFQSICSLDMELYSQSSKKLEREDLDKVLKSKEKKEPVEKISIKIEEPEVGKDDVKMIIKSSLILSPVKGKHISELAPGDRVKVKIIEQGQKAIKIAEAFNAYKENKILPIIGRVKSIHGLEKGFLIFVVLAKGILARIEEEEENIKVAMDPSYVWADTEVEAETGGDTMQTIIIIGVVAFVIIAAVLIILFKK